MRFSAHFSSPMQRASCDWHCDTTHEPTVALSSAAADSGDSSDEAVISAAAAPASARRAPASGRAAA
jgi:hypothetical protein